MVEFWHPRRIGSIAQFENLLGPLTDRRWLFRGQPRVWGSLIPSIDRPPRERPGRVVKLFLERRSIEAFRLNVRTLTNQSERLAITDPHIALMVLRHYDVPTRILDWSLSPHVAAFFAAETCETADGEIWAFDEPLYECEGRKQWDVGPPVTRKGEFHPQYTMFMPNLGLIDWFVCAFICGAPSHAKTLNVVHSPLRRTSKWITRTTLSAFSRLPIGACGS
jgi:hypothetical protein